MVYQVFGNRLVVRLETGDELLESILKVCEETGFTTASVTGIGATDDVEIGSGNEDENRYYIQSYHEKLEMCNISGNVTHKGDLLNCHLHVVLGAPGGGAFGGHVHKAVVKNTAEIFIDRIDGEIDRKLFEGRFYFMDL